MLQEALDGQARGRDDPGAPAASWHLASHIVRTTVYTRSPAKA